MHLIHFDCARDSVVSLLASQEEQHHEREEKPVVDLGSHKQFHGSRTGDAILQISSHKVEQFNMAGYSGTPLAKKLGIKTTVVAINEPANYRKLLGSAAEDVTFLASPRKGSNFIHLFTTRRKELQRRLERLRSTMDETGIVWVSWPKKSSRVSTDVTEDVIRAVALPLGFVDVKVCAVDETWSGLKLMIRRQNRQSAK
jgi:hypothetical protein